MGGSPPSSLSSFALHFDWEHRFSEARAKSSPELGRSNEPRHCRISVEMFILFLVHMDWLPTGAWVIKVLDIPRASSECAKVLKLATSWF